ncbi:MAG: hypothetical protein AABW90_03040 [Nanoarchaeota archaeon]
MTNDHVKLIPREIREASFPIASFLSEEEQVKYEDSIKQFRGKAYDSLNIPIEGSNLFKVLWLNQIGIPTATLSELKQAIDNGMDLIVHYEDAPSVVLRSNGDSYEPNDYLASSLAEVINEREFEHSLILNGLELKADENSDYGLVLVPGEKFEKIEAPDFDYINNRKRFSRINPDYTIEWNEQGNKTLYSRNKSLSRFSVAGDLDLDSYTVHLAYSDSFGRVVVVSSGGAKNFDEYLSKLKEERDKQKVEFGVRFERAMNHLKPENYKK